MSRMATTRPPHEIYRHESPPYRAPPRVIGDAVQGRSHSAHSMAGSDAGEVRRVLPRSLGCHCSASMAATRIAVPNAKAARNSQPVGGSLARLTASRASHLATISAYTRSRSSSSIAHLQNESLCPRPPLQKLAITASERPMDRTAAPHAPDFQRHPRAISYEDREVQVSS